jgi:hypothetical protein
MASLAVPHLLTNLLILGYLPYDYYCFTVKYLDRHDKTPNF